eukprot:1046876-Amorphochlora_amoeboformis.AAC.1
MRFGSFRVVIGSPSSAQLPGNPLKSGDKCTFDFNPYFIRLADAIGWRYNGEIMCRALTRHVRGCRIALYSDSEYV